MVWSCCRKFSRKKHLFLKNSAGGIEGRKNQRTPLVRGPGYGGMIIGKISLVAGRGGEKKKKKKERGRHSAAFKGCLGRVVMKHNPSQTGIFSARKRRRAKGSGPRIDNSASSALCEAIPGAIFQPGIEKIGQPCHSPRTPGMTQAILVSTGHRRNRLC